MQVSIHERIAGGTSDVEEVPKKKHRIHLNKSHGL